MKRACASLLLWLPLCMLPVDRAIAAPDDPRGLSGLATTVDAAAEAITTLRLEEAERVLASVKGREAEQPAVLFQLARLHYYRGDYASAVGAAERAMERATDRQRERFSQMLELMRASERIGATYEQMVSDDGRFVVLHQKGKDAMLAVHAIEVLARADTALEKVFGTRMPGPIRLEIYPGAETLAEVSTLTLEQIQTTGTIALSKWNRLMLTSPKALVRGYPWADTVTHELIHMVLSRMTLEHAPVWLQEGTAKLFERAWRGGEVGKLDLDPGAQALLVDAHKSGELLTFEQMHPSIAMLPSEDDAALAFAQVATFMERYVQDHGLAKLRDALQRIASGRDARAALAAAAGVSFAQLERGWKSGLPADDGVKLKRLKRRFRVGDGPHDESEEVEESQARRYMRIGDLLWDRGRIAAAAKEYRKAHGADPLDPIVAARFGRAALQSGDPQGAVDALARQAELYPGHGPTHAVLGVAQAELGNRDAAQVSLREAVWTNPFDPAPHCALAKVGATRREIDRALEACALLSP